MNPRAHFSASLMSDAKWRKLFHVTVEHVDRVSAAVWKLLDEEQPVPGRLPSSRGEIWHTAVDGCLNGPVSYNKIEWLKVPRTIWYQQYANAPLSSRIQGIEALSTALSKVGKFPMEQTADELLFRGYSHVV